MSVNHIGSVNIYIVEKDELLLSRRANTGWMDGSLCPPGGHIEDGEAPSEAIIREVQEELGLTLNNNDFEFLCVAARKGSPRNYVAYEFISRDKNLKVVNAEPEKCSELVWVNIDKLPSDIIPDFRKIIDESVIGNSKYLELGYSQ